MASNNLNKQLISRRSATRSREPTINRAARRTLIAGWCPTGKTRAGAVRQCVTITGRPSSRQGRPGPGAGCRLPGRQPKRNVWFPTPVAADGHGRPADRNTTTRAAPAQCSLQSCVTLCSNVRRARDEELLRHSKPHLAMMTYEASYDILWKRARQANRRRLRVVVRPSDTEQRSNVSRLFYAWQVDRYRHSGWRHVAAGSPMRPLAVRARSSLTCDAGLNKAMS